MQIYVYVLVSTMHLDSSPSPRVPIPGRGRLDLGSWYLQGNSHLLVEGPVSPTNIA